ncbi:zinc finger protein 37-like [Physella acuta]|uniref:zinc finger protein 37-like n=1 Tax=Physella acuta TaxID=109671 RepID=UPI0027DCFBBA|nr:zinc finger protein 37-like [Physella acuta]XP_059173323.1 zinc finger protein 37-like [Physella acuta]XP_059173325.1 zinc finger protein 37-like [Physella acuta]
MEDCGRKDHLYEAVSASGVLVYVIDNKEPVCVKFSSTVQVKVLFDCHDEKWEEPHQVNGDFQPFPAGGDAGNAATSLAGDVAEDSMPVQPDGEGGHKSDQGLLQEVVRKPGRQLRQLPDRKKGIKKTDVKVENEGDSVGSKGQYRERLRSSGKRVKKMKRKIPIEAAEEDVCKIERDDDYGDDDQQPPVKSRKLLAEKTVRCDYCELEFKTQLDFYNHRRAAESKHTCQVCGKTKPYEAYLIVHMQKHKTSDHENNGESITSGKQSSGAGRNSSKDVRKKNKKERMKCDLCGLVVSSMDSLKIHTMLHTGESAYRCCVCQETFSSLSSRQHHMDVHVSAQRFKCNPCGQRFVSRADLAKHQLTHEIKCALCGEVFPNKTSRTCHFRVSHPNDILKCTLCSNMFATEEDLNKHLIYHKKGKKEQCPECGVVVSKLKDHMLLHSQQAQEKLYVCDQCPMRYLRKSNLDRHMRTHTGEKPYACNKCTKRFRSNGMLRKHLLTHTQERPYQCEVCGKRCSLRSNLNIHMRVHNTDRHYSCTLCSQAFNHKNSLHGHMKNKHSRELTFHNPHSGLAIESGPPATQDQMMLGTLLKKDVGMEQRETHTEQAEAHMEHLGRHIEHRHLGHCDTQLEHIDRHGLAGGQIDHNKHLDDRQMAHLDRHGGQEMEHMDGHADFLERQHRHLEQMDAPIELGQPSNPEQEQYMHQDYNQMHLALGYNYNS